MNFTRLFLVSLIGVLALGASCAKKEAEVAGLDIKVKETPAIRFCYVENIGPYDQLEASFAKIGALVAEQQVTGNVMGIFFSDPEKVPPEELRSEIGVEVAPEFQPPEGFKVKEIPARTVAYVVMKGPYEVIAQEYKKILVWAGRNDYQIAGPLMEVYLKGGPQVPPQEYLTEVRLPVMRRE